MSVLSSARPSGKLARWALTIQELNLIIKHRAGKLNVNADALSCNPCEVTCLRNSGDSELSVDVCFECPDVSVCTNCNMSGGAAVNMIGAGCS